MAEERFRSSLDFGGRKEVQEGDTPAISEGGAASGIGAGPASVQDAGGRVKLLADLDALVAYVTDKTGTMPMPEVSDIPGTMRRAAAALRSDLYVQGEESVKLSRSVLSKIMDAVRQYGSEKTNVEILLSLYEEIERPGISKERP